MVDGKPTRFDPRGFIALDHGMPENPKVVDLDDAAFRMYIEAICYCSRQHTDGLIKVTAMRRLGSDESAKTLLDAKLFERRGKDYEVHDYLFHQRSSDEIAQIREAKADNGTKGAHVRWHVAKRKPDPKCSLCYPDGALASA
jgi:hypothetical protein